MDLHAEIAVLVREIRAHLCGRPHSPRLARFPHDAREVRHMAAHVVRDARIVVHRIDARSRYRAAAVRRHLVPVLDEESRENTYKQPQPTRDQRPNRNTDSRTSTPAIRPADAPTSIFGYAVGDRWPKTTH